MPVRSGSSAPIDCLNVIVAGAFETGSDQVAGLMPTRSGCWSVRLPVGEAQPQEWLGAA